jgi:hypothetical protein
MSLPSAATDRIRSRIEAGLTTVQAWEADPSLLFECRCLIPFHLLRDDDARVPEGSLFSPGPPRTEEAAEFYREDDASYQGDDLLLKRLTLYFQKHGMAWCNNPPCVKCGCKDTEGVGVRGPVTVEEREGGASRVERKLKYNASIWVFLICCVFPLLILMHLNFCCVIATYLRNNFTIFSE